mmetsp:Transcript_3211/g.11632  ORF Transcript_3211/g.11632 Transcript_3211/m.11632 type:complete len:230 (+) Transcript_3211:550-1239(+)
MRQQRRLCRADVRGWRAERAGGGRRLRLVCEWVPALQHRAAVQHGWRLCQRHLHRRRLRVVRRVRRGLAVHVGAVHGAPQRAVCELERVLRDRVRDGSSDDDVGSRVRAAASVLVGRVRDGGPDCHEQQAVRVVDGVRAGVSVAVAGTDRHERSRVRAAHDVRFRHRVGVGGRDSDVGSRVHALRRGLSQRPRGGGARLLAAARPRVRRCHVRRRLGERPPGRLRRGRR